MSTQREIKFRFWSGQKMFNELDEVMACLAQQMAFNEQCVGFVGSTICYDHVGENGASFMQYTGLKDKSGREIYEGDIVENHWPEKNEGIYVVRFSGSDFGTRFEIVNHATGVNRWWKEGTCKVIGNIHENPEMIAR